MLGLLTPTLLRSDPLLIDLEDSGTTSQMQTTSASASAPQFSAVFPVTDKAAAGEEEY